MTSRRQRCIILYIEREVVRPRTISIQRIAEVPLTHESETIRALAPTSARSHIFSVNSWALFSLKSPALSLVLDFIGMMRAIGILFILLFIFIRATYPVQHCTYTCNFKTRQLKLFFFLLALRFSQNISISVRFSCDSDDKKILCLTGYFRTYLLGLLFT